MTAESAGLDDGAEPRLGRSDRLQPLLLIASIGVGLGIGRAAPSLADLAARTVSVGVFVLIMLVMLNVNPRSVAGVLTQRRFLGAAIGLNFIVNPLLAWLLGTVFLSGQPELRVGFVLFLVTPCIGWYLVFTELAGGDTELGVGLLGVNVVLQILLLPVYLAAFVGESTTLGIGSLAESVAAYLVAPAVVAWSIRRWWKHRGRSAAEEQRRLRVSTLKTAALVLVIVAMFASQASAIFDEVGAVVRLIVPMVVFFAVAFGCALLSARLLHLPHGERVLLAFTTTSRNSEASLAIAATAFASPLVALTVALGPVIELPLLVLMVRSLRPRPTGDQMNFAGGRRCRSTVSCRTSGRL